MFHFAPEQCEISFTFAILASTLRGMAVALAITLFVLFGVGFVWVNLLVGSLARPRVPSAAKAAIYECGEPSIGSSWVQFDLRFYIIALVFLIFDVEVALFYPWAVAYGSAAALGAELGMDVFSIRRVAIVDMLFFFGVLLVGFAYLWRFGYLDWVRSAATTSLRAAPGASRELSRQARLDQPLEV